MTNEEIRIKVAESLGVEFSKWGKDWMLLTSPSTTEPIRIKLNGRTLEQGRLDYVSALPNYPESLDACAEFEATLTSSEISDYPHYLLQVVRESGTQDKFIAQLGCFSHITATAAQRCLAYLKTKGLMS